MKDQKTILVLGGGFGGLRAALRLAKKTSEETKIILVNKHDYHLYYPALYEIAAFEEEFGSIAKLKQSVTVNFVDILPKRVQFVQGEVQLIAQKEKFVTVSGQNISFDYLIVALGARPDYFGIPGAAENSTTFGSLNDVLKIRNACEFAVEAHQKDVTKKKIRFVVAGGGVTGAEVAGELVNFAEVLAWKYGYSDEKIEIAVVEAANQLLPGMPAVVSSSIFHRLRSQGVNILLNSMIASVDKEKISLANGEVYNYDVLVWTTGVRSVDLPFQTAVETDRKHRGPTNPDLSLVGYPDIYMIGDNACVLDENKMPLPQTATQAMDQADYVADLIIARMKNKTLPKFKNKTSPFIIPVKGKWAVLRLRNGFTMTGVIPWLAKFAAAGHYFIGIMPLGMTIKKVLLQMRLFVRND